MGENFIEQVIRIVAIAFVLTFSEAIRGVAAARFGDTSAKADGRLTFDPSKHTDLFGTILLPALFVLSNSFIVMGWAKPLYINYNRLRPYFWGRIFVESSEIAFRVFLAWLTIVITLFIPDKSTLATDLLGNIMQVSLVFTAFSLLPFPFTTMGTIITHLLPSKWAIKYQNATPHCRIAFMAIILLPALLPGRAPDLLGLVIMPIYYYLLQFVLFAAGY